MDSERRSGRGAVLAGEAGLTLMEVLVAMFIVSIGVIGVMASLPVGIDTAQQIIVQDNSINLAMSKFAEFRRDRIDPASAGLGTYHAQMLIQYNARHGGAGDKYRTDICQGRVGCLNYYGWHDFEKLEGDPFIHFPDIEEYEWRLLRDGHRAVEPQRIDGAGGAGDDYYAPDLGASVDTGGVSTIGLYLVTIQVRKKKTSKVFFFKTFLTKYDG